MMMKILILVLVSAAVVDQSAADAVERRDELSKTVVAAIRNVLQVLKKGVSVAELDHDFTEILAIVDEMLGDGKADVDKSKVHAFVNGILAQVHVEETDDKSQKSAFHRAFSVLDRLADLLEAKLDTTDKDELNKILYSIKVIVDELREEVDRLDDAHAYVFHGAQADSEATSAVRRARAGAALNRDRRCWALCCGK